MTNFRFSSSKVLLTYSQVCEAFTAETILYDFEARFRIDTYVIGEERHEDGGRHYHAAITFKNKLDTRDQTYFDIACGEHQHHPNIKSIQRGQANLDRARDYCRKEDPAPLSNVTEKLTWGEMIAQSNTANEFLAKVREYYPEKYCQNLKQYEYSASQLYRSFTSDTIQTYQWDAEEEPEAWNRIDQLTTEWNPQSHALLLVGPAGCGKTTWAKLHAPKPCLFVTHLDQLTLLRQEHQSILFDDMCFRHLPTPTQKFLVDIRDIRTIHVRYRVATLPAGVTRLFTSNSEPFFCQEPADMDAINRRLCKINLY